MESPNLSYAGSDESSIESECPDDKVQPDLVESDKDEKQQVAEKEKDEKETYLEVQHYIRKVTTLFDIADEDWTNEVMNVIKQFILSPGEPVLVIFYEELNLQATFQFPTIPVHDLMYFLRKSKVEVTMENFFDVVTFGSLNGNMEGSVLNLLECIYAPVFFENSTLPEEVKGELFGKMHEFLAHLTDVHYKLYGLTILYVPREGTSIVGDEAAQNKELVRRLEGVMMHWSRQLRVAISDVSEGSVETLLTLTDEYQFWLYRWESLTLLFQQLETPGVKQIINILTLAQSSYLVQFRSLLKEMTVSLDQTVSNIEYLQGLLKPCQEMSSETDVNRITDHIPVIFNVIRDIWTNSPYFNSSERLVPLCRNLAHQVILQCQASVDIDALFDLGHTKTCVTALQANIKCCRRFKIIYREMSQFYSEFQPETLWNLDESSFCGVIDSFIRRNLDLIEICESMVTFGRLSEEMLDKPILGGSKGAELSVVLDDVERQFLIALDRISKLRCAILDVLIPDWQRDMCQFRNELRRMELQLINLLSTAMEQTVTVEDALFCLQAFHHYSCRPSVYRLFEQKTVELWGILQAELHVVRQQLLSSTPLRQSNTPVNAGSALSLHLQKLRLLRLKNLLESANWLPFVNVGQETIAQLNYIVARIDILIKAHHVKWNDSLEDDPLPRLNCPLMRRSSARPGLLEPFFDLVVRNVANESFYWQLLEMNLPHPAERIITTWKKLRLLYENVLSVILDYNKIVSALSDPERLLFKELIRKNDLRISPGLFKFTWNSDNVDEFVESCFKSNLKLNSFLGDYKCAVFEMLSLCETICETKMLNIAHGVVFELNDLEEQIETYRNEAFIKIMEIYQSVLKHLMTIYEGFEEVIQATGVHWHKFILKLDSMLEEALVLCVTESMQLMLDALKGDFALLNVCLHLENEKISFTPTLRRVSSLGNHFLAEVVGAFKIIPRIYDKLKLQGRNPQQFYEVIDMDPGCRALQIAVNAEVSRNVAAIQDYLKMWEPYRRLWEINKDEFVKKYRQRDPPVEEWEADIKGFDDLADTAQQEETYTTVHFTRLDSGPLKMSITHLCIEWKEKLCKVLLDKAAATVESVFAYCEEETSNLREHPKNLLTLQAKLTKCADLSQSCNQIEATFPRIEEQFEILEKNDVEVPPEISQRRLNLSKRWKTFLNDFKAAEEMLQSSKETFKAGLLEKCEESRVKTIELLQNLSEKGPLSSKWSAKSALQLLKVMKSEVEEIVRLEEELRTDLAVFDISHASNLELEQIEEELIMLQSAWDTVAEWEEIWEHCRKSNFWSLDNKAMEDKTQEISKKMARLSGSLAERRWDILDVAMGQIDAVEHCLPLVVELKNTSLRARHWQAIQDLVRQHFDPHSPDFTVGVMLDMKLHEHASAIYDIGKTSALELNIENSLENIRNTWSTCCITIEPYEEIKGIFRLLSVDNILETIDEHQTTLAAMKGTKFVEAFLADVEYWERTLSVLEEGLDLLLTFQRQWIYLESIFSGDDITQQLPEETALFEGLSCRWRTITLRMHEQKNVLACNHPDLVTELRTMLVSLEDIQKMLTAFLEDKRRAFPRFYFISNDDLLDILGNSKKPELLQPHLKKLFDNIARLGIERAGSKVEAISMTSNDGETIDFLHPILCDGPVEAWLSDVEAVMRTTLRHELKNTKTLLRKSFTKRDKWLKEQPGQLCITASQVQWTTDCTRALTKCRYTNSYDPLKVLRKKQKKILHMLSDLLRSSISKLFRLKVVALVTIEIHSRDVIDTLCKAKATDASDFKWISQLRFYWDKAKGDCEVRQTNATFNYGYEYLGNSGRLAVTPLTDRCYITLTTALYLHRGGSPKGPAGTGKTETVKDLGKALGTYVIVFNCSEGLDYKSMGHLLSGLAQTGAWGCFDEFNRINIEVLSVVAQQILSILSALSAVSTKFMFEGSETNLASTCGIFITMNPGYAGRTELPENLKAMFRPISMVVPDSVLIAEVTLYAEGFHDSKSLSHKVVTLFYLTQQQLSKQDHYDFGLRGMVSLLRYAGTKRRALVQLSDAEVLLLAVREMNIAKLTVSDLALFNDIVSDLFPDVDPPLVDTSFFRDAVIKSMCDAHLQPVSQVVNKVIQLYEIQSSRHSVMLVGDTCTGKSTIWRTLMATLIALSSSGYHSPSVYPINPKALALGELFGEFNMVTGEWHDGIVSSIMRKVCSDEALELKWILFDGPVDAVWIENMNSAMDDNKVLTLINSERISMPDQVSFLFEVENLREASPATISRAGMVYTDYTDLTWRPYVESWLQNLQSKTLSSELRGLINCLLPRVLEFKRVNCMEIIALHELANVRSLCRLLECFCVESVDDVEESNSDFAGFVKLWFLFCLTWSVCGTLDEVSRCKMDTFLRESESVYPVKGTIYDYYVDPKQRNMSAWENRLDENWLYKNTLPFHEVIVPTVDTIRYQCLISHWLDSGHPLLLVGPAGVGKTCTLQRFLQQRPCASLSAVFSASTSAPALQDLLQSRLEKRSKGVYAPTGGHRLVVFLDDFNMPACDDHGSQPPLELIRQWLDYGFWYDRHNQWKIYINDVVLCGAMGPPGGGRNKISSRLLSKFNVLALTFPDQQQIMRIYLTLLSQHLASFDEEINVMAESVTRMTLDLYFMMVETMLPTPKKTHYLFNLRDISRVFQGLLRSHKDYQNTSKRLLNLWTHEVYRVFCDRLVDDLDRQLFSDKVDELLGNYMNTTLSALYADKRPLIFGEFMSVDNRYEEICDLEILRSHMEVMLKEYNQKPRVVSLKLVLFQEAVEHVCRIARVISQPRGHILLMGIGGSGRTSLARLALYLSNQRASSISISRNYGVSEFREDLKILYRETGVEERPTGFLFNDNQIVVDQFLEIVNSILGTGEVPNLYRPEDLEEIRAVLNEKTAKKGIMLTSGTVLPYLIERSRQNLHVIMSMNPADESFRLRLMRYPALVSCTTIDWILPWTQQALVEVALHSLRDCDFVDNIFPPQIKEITDLNQAILLRNKVTNIFAEMHAAVEVTAREMWQQLRRKCYITPTCFLHLISTYVSLLAEKRHLLRTQANKLQNGLGRIEEARAGVTVMSVDLEQAQSKVLVIQVECETAMAAMVGKKRNVDEQAVLVKVQSERIAEEEMACRALAQAAHDDLEEALPALDEALAALESLSKKDISELKSYGKPPPKVMMVMEAVCILKGVTPDWAESKRILGEQDFLKSLKEYDKEHIPEKTMKKLATYTGQEDFDPERVESVSLAARSLCMWVIAIENYGKLWKIVGPKKRRLEETTASLQRKQNDLAQLTKQLDDLKGIVSVLNEELEQKTQEMDDLKRKADDLQLKLQRAEMLVDGLAEEKLRWESTVADLEKSFIDLPGACLVPSAFLSYAGPFASVYRTTLVQMWSNLVSSEENVVPSSDVKLLDFLVDPAIACDWGDMGLPMDDYSIENGTLIVLSSRSPVVIDPQLQAHKWIKNMERSNNLTIVDEGTSNLMIILEKCILSGTPVLLENVQERIEPSLVALLSKQLVVEAGQTMIKLGGKLVSYNHDFRLFVTTKLPNPNFSTEISTKTTVVNFSIKQEGLEAQLLGLVVRRERPDLEDLKTKTLQTISSGRKTLLHLETELLRLLYESEGSLLENEQLFTTLQDSRLVAKNIKEGIETAEATEVEIEGARAEYLPCAKRAAILFVAITDLSEVDPMYQFSLDTYLDLLRLSLEKSAKHHVIANRIQNITEYHTYALYRNVCNALFSRHKLMFAFYISIKILENTIPAVITEYNALLRGVTIVNREAQPRNPAPTWLSPSTWDAVVDLEAIPSLKGIARSFQDNIEEWKVWYFEKTPETAPLPNPWNTLSALARLLLVRALCEHRLITGITEFVKLNLGQKFVEPMVFDINAAYEESTPTAPLIFILSPGVDPIAGLRQFAESKGMLDSFLTLSLGQGQSDAAACCIERGVREGYWIYLANCHLSLSWMPALDRIVKDLRTKQDINNKFRLWLSSNPNRGIPISLLQNGVKMTTEPPQGIRGNLTRLYLTLTHARYTRCRDNATYMRLLFSLGFFHAVLLERRKFQQLGWNVVYSFNDSDFEVSENILSLYLDDYETTPWEAIKYMIAEVSYGGHVTDIWDRRLLMTYANEFLSQNVISQKGFRFSSLLNYTLPIKETLEASKEHIANLPAADPSEVFGQHANAEISYLMMEGRSLCETLLSMHTHSSFECTSSMEEKASSIIEEIHAQLPSYIDLEDIEKNFASSGSLEIVLLQEAARYNTLLRTVTNSLIDAHRAITGHILLSSELNDFIICLVNARVPPAWLKAYPSLKSLGSWARDLADRVGMLSRWASSTCPPNVFWLAAFTFPTAFLTAVLQETARKTGSSIDALAWQFHVMDTDVDYDTEVPKEGVLVHGLYLEGAGWDVEGKHLIDPPAMQVVCCMPVILFRPSEHHKTKSKGLYTCPAYYYPKRSESFVIAVGLNSGLEPQETWIKRGTALLLSIA